MEVRTYDKVFVVGFNKHATTAIHQLFHINDFKCYHGVNWWKHRAGSKAIEIVHQHDVLSDGSPQLIRGELQWLVDKYPDSRFIFPVRDLTDWIISRFCHGIRMRQHAPKNIDAWMWAYPFSVDKAKKWVRQINIHIANVFELLKKQPERLWVIDIDSPDWQKFVMDDFLLPIPDKKRRNITPNMIHTVEKIQTMLQRSNFDFQNSNTKYRELITDRCIEHGYNTNMK